MKLIKLLKIMCVLTSLALVYIHMQMQIIDLAYRGKAKENQIRKLVENNGNMRYTILTLKSANNLGYKMLAENSQMQFADQDDIVRIATPRVNSNDMKEEFSDKQMAKDPKAGSLFSVLSSFGIK